MILVFELEYRSFSQVYERLFEQALLQHGLEGRIVREHFALKLYVEAANAEDLETFVNAFSATLPHSIFLYANDAKMVEEMPEEGTALPPREPLSLPFCPSCLNRAVDPKSKDYYNIFTACSACGYGIDGEQRSCRSEIAEAAVALSSGESIGIHTFYGSYSIGLISPICESIDFDVIAYDIATIGKNAEVEEYELAALASFEKPLVRLRIKPDFPLDRESLRSDLIRFKLPDDMILQLLMKELHGLGIDMIFVTQTEIPVYRELSLVVPQNIQEPIEVLAAKEHTVVIRGEKGLPVLPISAEKVNAKTGMFYSVIKEHRLKQENIAGVILSRKHPSTILVHGAKYGTIEYLSMNFQFESMQEIFDQITASNETGAKIVENYTKKFPELMQRILDIVFEEQRFNIYRLWGVVSIVLDYAKGSDPLKAARKLEERALAFLGAKGPRIDYKLYNDKGKVYLDPLMTIRTAMSFRLAGVDPQTLSYGVIESFLEFVTNELDEMQQSMDISAVAAAGSLLDNKRIFAKMSQEIGKNHDLYFNNQLLVEGRNMFYGGVSLES